MCYRLTHPPPFQGKCQNQHFGIFWHHKSIKINQFYHEMIPTFWAFKKLEQDLIILQNKLAFMN